MTREDAIKYVFDNHGENAIYITNTGYLSRAIYNMYPDNKNIFYMVGSMGLSPAIGIGLALHTRKEVVVFVGDASLLMHLGITNTLAELSGQLENLTVYLFDNGCHESVGGQKCCVYGMPLGVRHINVNKGEKSPRVGIGCVENAENIKNIVRSFENR